MESRELAGLSGGKKQLWLRNNRQLILDYYREFGEAETCEKFNLKKDTLDRIINREASRQRYVSQDDFEKALTRVDIAESGVRSLRREVRDIRYEYYSATDRIAVRVETVIHRLAQLITGPQPEMREPEDPLALTDFYPQRKRIETKKDDD